MNNGLAPDVWGNNGWAFIHYVALGYPDDPSMLDINNYKNFYINIGNVLPCHTCKKHYNTMIANNPPDTKSRDTLFKWTVDIHNEVNKRLNKKTINYHEALNIWTHTKTKTEQNIDIKSIIIIILSLIIIYKLFN